MSSCEVFEGRFIQRQNICEKFLICPQPLQQTGTSRQRWYKHIFLKSCNALNQLTSKCIKHINVYSNIMQQTQQYYQSKILHVSYNWRKEWHLLPGTFWCWYFRFLSFIPLPWRAWVVIHGPAVCKLCFICIVYALGQRWKCCCSCWCWCQKEEDLSI